MLDQSVIYKTRKLYSNTIINIHCYYLKYSVSTQNFFWLTRIKDGRSNSPPDEYESIGMYRRLTRKEKKVIKDMQKQKVPFSNVRMGYFNSKMQHRHLDISSMYFPCLSSIYVKLNVQSIIFSLYFIFLCQSIRHYEFNQYAFEF